MTIKLNQRERDTILAALRYYQAAIENGDGKEMRSDILCIATNDGQHLHMTANEIDQLCEDINCT